MFFAIFVCVCPQLLPQLGCSCPWGIERHWKAAPYFSFSVCCIGKCVGHPRSLLLQSLACLMYKYRLCKPLAGWFYGQSLLWAPLFYILSKSSPFFSSEKGKKESCACKRKRLLDVAQRIFEPSGSIFSSFCCRLGIREERKGGPSKCYKENNAVSFSFFEGSFGEFTQTSSLQNHNQERLRLEKCTGKKMVLWAVSEYTPPIYIHRGIHVRIK